MAVQELITTHQEAGQRIAPSAYEYVAVDVALAGGTDVTIAPFDGKLVRAYIVVGSLHNATNNYLSIGLTNKTDSDNLMIAPGSNDTGDGTDTLQYGKRVLVITPTVADLVVSEGDFLELASTAQGTLTADSVVVLVYEVA